MDESNVNISKEDVGNLVDALRDNRAAVTGMLDDQNTRLDKLGTDLQLVQISLSRVDSKLADYDRIVAMGWADRTSMIIMLEDIKNIKAALATAKEDKSAGWSRATSIIAVLVSLAAFILYLAQHVQLHP